MFNKAIILVISLISFSCNFGQKKQGCHSSVNVSNVSFNVKPNNVLRYDVSYQLSDTIQSFIKFWEKKNPDIVNFIKFPKGVQVHSVLYGIKADTEYAAQIVFEKNCDDGSELVEFKTGKLPYQELVNFDLTKDNIKFNGYILFHQTIGSIGHLHVIVDDNGEVVWYQYFDGAVNTFSWTTDNTLLAVIAKTQIIEMDLSGNIIFSLKYGEKGFDKKIHHEIQKDDLGHIYGLTYEKKGLSFDQKVEYGVDTLFCDGVLVLDSAGNKFWEWSMYNVVTPTVNSFTKKVPSDWAHGNALYDDKAGNYLLSFRNLNQIWSISKTSGELNWKFGENTIFNLREKDLFAGQHAVYINRNGKIMLFDNGERGKGISRALSFNIDAESNTYEKILDVELPKNLYSFKKGNTQLIGDECLLFNSTQTKTIAISNLKNSIEWELKLPRATYRAEYIDSIYY